MSDASRLAMLYSYGGSESKLLRRDNVQVHYDPVFSRKPNPILDNRIDEFRLRFLSAPGEYDTSYFRLAGLSCEDGELRLCIGLTTYLEYLAFRSVPDILNGISDPRSVQGEYLPNVLGNIGVLLTADDFTFCIVRSRNVRTYRGFADFPGGHPEPARVDLLDQLRDGSRYCSGNLIRNELFDAVIREIHEDLGTGLLKFDEPLLLAILANVEDVMKPDMVFMITTPHTGREIRESFAGCNPKPSEVAEIKSFDLMNPGRDLDGYPMTPVMEGALSVLQKLGRRGLERELFEARNCR
jgi:hypothetical protein